jgi:hypothetical protein
MNRYACFAALLACAAMGSAHAVPMSFLVNTGSAGSGAIDTRYELTVEQGATRLSHAYGYVAQDDAVGHMPWLTNSAESKWITPELDGQTTFDGAGVGVYRYSLSFDMTGYQADTAHFNGRFSADNAAQVFLNGKLLATGTDFTRWSSFGADDGFNGGVNVLEFIVTNYAQLTGNPTGLRVEYMDSFMEALPPQRLVRAALFEVPEPASAALFMSGLAMMACVARRRSGYAAC